MHSELHVELYCALHGELHSERDASEAESCRASCTVCVVNTSQNPRCRAPPKWEEFCLLLRIPSLYLFEELQDESKLHHGKQ
jgi:hypothetical protein